MERGYRATEDAATGNFIERPEPCEGKLSRTVLRGAWASYRVVYQEDGEPHEI